MPWLAKIHCACNFLDIIEIQVKSKKAIITLCPNSLLMLAFVCIITITVFCMTGLGCSECECTQYSVDNQCRDDGTCVCKSGVGGDTCTYCLPG